LTIWRVDPFLFFESCLAPSLHLFARFYPDSVTLRCLVKPALAQLAISLPLDPLRHGLACPAFPCDAWLCLRGLGDYP
jgi:hypothetical protein